MGHSPHRDRTWARWGGPALLLHLLALLVPVPACWNGIGVTCPPGDPNCSVLDLSAPVPDLGAPDLRPPPDLAHPDLSRPDLASCRIQCGAGCCDPGNVCHDPTTVDFCGGRGGDCIACDKLLADRCADGGCVCGLTGAPCLKGQRCADGKCVCDDKTCPAGCCSPNQLCFSPPDLAHCNIGGAACVECDPSRADGCGGNPMTAAACSCGKNPMCDVGQLCKAGVCKCNQNGCPGCCDKLTEACLPVVWPVCGGKGGACAACDKLLTDSCDANGQCSCGGGAPCGAGQLCLKGACVCNANSCPTGCCAGTTCNVNQTPQSCATKGAACVACGDGANACANGVCVCGNNPACPPGQRCTNGKCVCDPVLCATGCCDNNNDCKFSNSACGRGGGNCTMCQNNSVCLAGLCLPVVNPCGANLFLCLADKQCYGKCTKCIAGGRAAAQCGINACVGSCADCDKNNKTCVDLTGALVCIDDCKNCPTNQCN